MIVAYNHEIKLNNREIKIDQFVCEIHQFHSALLTPPTLLTELATAGSEKCTGGQVFVVSKVLCCFVLKFALQRKGRECKPQNKAHRTLTS